MSVTELNAQLQRVLALAHRAPLPARLRVLTWLRQVVDLARDAEDLAALQAFVIFAQDELLRESAAPKGLQ